MGLSDFLKKVFWSDVKKSAAKIIESEQNINTKTSFSVKYSIAFKGEEHGFDSDDKEFKNKPCYNSNHYDGSEASNCTLCSKLVELNKLYSRKEIEQLSMKLGYDTFANIGGTVDENGFPNCACYWQPEAYVKNNL